MVLRILIPIIALLAPCTAAMAESPVNPVSTNDFTDRTDFLPPQPPMAFAKHYISFEGGKNFPVGRSAEAVKPGFYHPKIGYRYVMDDTWLTGVSAQFKVLRGTEHATAVSLFTIEEQTQRLIRLYHPYYFAVGGKFMYLLPANKPRFPIQKHSQFGIEVGAGLSLAVLRQVGNFGYFGMYIDRWRGTKTTKLEGIETGLFLAAAIP